MKFFSEIQKTSYLRSFSLLTLAFALHFAPDGWAQSRRQKIANSPMVKDKETGKTTDWNLSGGLILGSPTGLVVKNEFAADQAIDLGLSYAFGKMLFLYGDWHYRFQNFLKNTGMKGDFLRDLEGYVGLGGAFLFSSSDNNPIRSERDDAKLGIMLRFPVGVQYRLPQKPFVFFLELAPGIGIIPGTFAWFGGGIGARYYF